MKPEGIVDATVCVPSGIVATPGTNCRTVTGRFGKQALDNRPPNWWGGQLVSGQAQVSANAIPADITGWKLYVAQEYLSRYGGSRAPSRAQQSSPAQPNPAPRAPAGPQEAAPDGNNDGNRNGNGNGRRRR